MMDKIFPLIVELERINAKWVFYILIVIFIFQKINFNRLKKTLNPITSKILSHRLKLLEELGMVSKNIIVVKPLRVEYYLTEKGKQFVNALLTSFGFNVAKRR